MTPSRLLLTLLLVLNGLPGRAEVMLGVTSPAVRFSPGVWAGDAGRGGAKSRTTWNSGAWCVWRWTTAAAHPSATLRLANPTPGSAVSYFLDGTLTDAVPVPASGGIAIQGLTAPGPHTLRVFTRHSRQEARWAGGNAFTVSGLTLDDGAAPLTLPPRRPWILIVGDSITEGIGAGEGTGAGDGDSALADYSFLVGRGLEAAGYDPAVSACGYSGWLRPGDAHGDVPAYFPPSGEARWNKINARVSLLDGRGHLSGWGGMGEEPAAILLNYGVNECLSGTDPAALSVSVTGALTALRRAAPHARLLVLVPPGLADTRVYPAGPRTIAALDSGVAAYRRTHPADKNAVQIDLGAGTAHALASPAYGGGVHPNAAGHAFLAPLVLQAVLRFLPHNRNL